jgi:hypothetical protein
MPFRVDVTDPVRESYSLMGSSDKALEPVRRVVRGDASYRELSTVGFEVTLDPPALRGPSMEIAELPLRDLATGLLDHWTLGTDLHDWATVMLMASVIQFAEAESDDETALLSALWSASANEPLTEAAIAVARRVASA